MTTNPKKPIVYAFIDSQNLNLGMRLDVRNERNKIIYRGGKLDFRKFRHYLREKYGVSKAYLFIGLIPTNNSLYEHLQHCGFTLIFKTISAYMDEAGQTITKGNVDTDIVLWAAAKRYREFDEAVFVSGDGDFLSLYEYMQEKGKLGRILVPNRFRYSKLLNTYRDKIAFVSDLPGLLEANKKTRSSGRITSLGQPGRGDEKSVAKKNASVNTSRSVNKPGNSRKRGSSNEA